MQKTKERYCCHCHKNLPPGSPCIATNLRNQGMKWLCRNCFDIYVDILNAKCNPNNIKQQNDVVRRLQQEWVSRRVGEETVFDQEVKFGIES